MLGTVRSVLAQTLTDWELVIVDDGSTDGTLALAEQIADPRVRVLSDGVNKGRSVRLNDLHAEARGRYVARMDADDLMFPERLEKQVVYLEAHPEVDLVGGGLISIGLENEIKGLRQTPNRVSDPYQILAGEVLYHPTVTGRTAWFRAHRYRAEYRYCDDYAMWAEAAATLQIANLQEPMIFYREHGLFTYDKFCGRIAEMEQALQTFGTPIVGEAAVRRLQRRRSRKNAVYHALQRLGQWERALAMVNRGLPKTERPRYEAVMRQILATPIPGID